jgi:uncharacterized protein YlxP (DUF503 family)
MQGYTSNMHVTAITIELRLPGCRSLKEKRSRLKSLLSNIHRHFNVSAAEIDHNDNWQFAVIACVIVSNNQGHSQRVLDKIPSWIESRRPDLQVVDDQLIVL